MSKPNNAQNVTYLDDSNHIVNNDEHIFEEFEQINGHDHHNAIALFDQTVSQYYLQKAKEHDVSSLEAVEMNAVGSNELAHRLLIIPASEPRHILMKLNIFENELATDMDLAAPVDRKHLLNFAALKADMIGLLAQLADL